MLLQHSARLFFNIERVKKTSARSNLSFSTLLPRNNLYRNYLEFGSNYYFLKLRLILLRGVIADNTQSLDAFYVFYKTHTVCDVLWTGGSKHRAVLCELRWWWCVTTHMELVDYELY